MTKHSWRSGPKWIINFLLEQVRAESSGQCKNSKEDPNKGTEKEQEQITEVMVDEDITVVVVTAEDTAEEAALDMVDAEEEDEVDEDSDTSQDGSHLRMDSKSNTIQQNTTRMKSSTSLLKSK